MTIALLLLLASLSQERGPFVDAAQFECLVQNIDPMIGHAEKVIVDISKCPPAIRHEYTSWPAERVTPVLNLTDAQLRCIRDNRRHLDRIVGRRPGNVYELQLDRCRPT